MYTPFFRESYIPDIDLSIKKSKYTPDIKPVESDIKEIREIEDKNPDKIISEVPQDLFSISYEKAGGDKNKYSFFRKLAEKESGFNHRIQNLYGAPAYGYFQFMQDGKKGNNISKFANTDIETFRNNPVLQIQAADRLANAFLSEFNEKDLRRAKELGYSKSALVAGAGLGGVGGVRKLLHQGVSVNDYSWSKDGKSGADMKSRMSEFNNMFKRGGVIKRDRGGKAYVSEGLKSRSNIADENLDSVTNIPFLKGAATKKLLRNMSKTEEVVNPNLVTPGSLGTYYYDIDKIYLRDNDPSTSVHEGTHASKPTAQKKVIDNIMESMGDAVFDQPHIYKDDYVDSSGEIYARLMQLRHHLGIDPNHVFTLKEVEEMKRKALKSQTLYGRHKEGVSETKFDNNGDIISADNLPSKGWSEDSKVFNSYQDEGVFDILNRYSAHFILRLLNEVASNKKLPEGVAYAQKGMQFVPPMLRRNSENYNYRLGVYDHPTHFLHSEAEQLIGNKRYKDFNGNYYTFESYDTKPLIHGYQPAEFPKYNQESTHKSQMINNPRTRYIYEQLTDGGLSHNQAIGIMANMWMESKFNPHADSGKYKGLVQLSPSLGKHYEEWKTKTGAIGTTQDQLQYLLPIITNRKDANPHKLSNQNIFINEGGGHGRQDKFLNSDVSPEDSAELFATLFERQGEKDMNKRRQGATLLNNIINVQK